MYQRERSLAWWWGGRKGVAGCWGRRIMAGCWKGEEGCSEGSWGGDGSVAGS